LRVFLALKDEVSRLDALLLALLVDVSQQPR
jgi:hypothetical protein